MSKALIKALEEMTREYSKNPSKQLKRRIDATRLRLGLATNKKSNRSKLKATETV